MKSAIEKHGNRKKKHVMARMGKVNAGKRIYMHNFLFNEQLNENESIYML